MPNEISTKNSPLFQQLLELEQELISGGSSYLQYPFLLQLTKITSLAKSQIYFSETSGNTSINQESAYTSTEILIGIDSSFLSRNRGRNNISLNSLFSLLYRLLY